MNTDPEQRIVFARFEDDDILDEMGRLLYSILNIFTTNGYQVRLFDNIDFSALDKYGQLVPSMDNLTLVDKVPRRFHPNALSVRQGRQVLCRPAMEKESSGKI